MKVKLLTRTAMGPDLWQAYTALRNADAAYDDPFFDPEFASLVSEVRSDTRFAIAEDAEGLLAVWPMHLRPGQWARPIGGPFSDWHAPIVRRAAVFDPEVFLAALDVSGFTAFGYKPEGLDALSLANRVGANMTDLNGSFDTYIAEQQRRWPKHFKKMRRLYRNVERDFSERHFTWNDPRDATVETLFALKRAQFSRTGFHDVLKPEWARQLLDRLRHHESPRLRLQVVSLYYEDQFAAAEMNLVSDTIMHGWLTAFDQALGVYSPGNMLVQDMLSEMPAHGLMTYDQGPGLDHYKRHYATYQIPVDSGVIRGKRDSWAPSRLTGHLWRRGEAVLPGKVAGLMARARRRMDQIALAETSQTARMAGVVTALSQREV
ncbi:MAG: GNAT family N-acetyltransferase [Pseudomonadota bacterium]